MVFVVDADTGALVKRFFLPIHTTPVGIAISPDGAHLYVSNFGSEFSTPNSLTVIDARRHALVDTYPTGTDVAGNLAVRGDDSRVFILHSDPTTGGLSAFDTTSHTIVASRTSANLGASIAASAALDRVFELSGFFRLGDSGQVRAYHAATLEPAGESALPTNRTALGMSLSRDGQRLHVLMDVMQMFNPSTTGGARFVLDPGSLAIVSQLDIPPGAQAGGDPVESTGTNELLAVGRNLTVLRRFPLTSTGMTSVTLRGEGLAITVPPGDARAYVTTRPHHLLGGLHALVAVDLASGSIAHTIPLSAATLELASTPPGVQACSYRLDSRYSSFPLSGGTGSIRLTTTCDWDASSSEGWARISTTAGSGTTTITLTVDPNVFPTPRTATLTIAGQLVTVTQAGAYSQPPFGVFETPVDGASGISGSLAVTGWALDDVGVSRVRVFRDAVAGEGDALIYIGDATFVEGSRPDVQAFMPTAPFANRAGWGLMLLTNMLPNGGNGTFRLSVFADDVEGQTSLLGTKTITTSNSTATRPFGAIDTPGQGEAVSGTIVNFGWALTPLPGMIPADGSTIDVAIDGVVVGHPVYNNFRGDVASLFPGYANSNGAVGYFILDTRTLANGVHTIAWVVRDSLGRAEGIGSRYFTVFNP